MTRTTRPAAETALAWLLERYGFASEDFAAVRERKLILDAGCGAGFATSPWIAPGWSDGAEWVGVDISTAIDVAERLGSAAARTSSRPTSRDRRFAPDVRHDLSEGVLHHTPSTEGASRPLVALAPGGELMFYVYRRKAPIREFTDDYVRDQLAELPPEEAWEALRPLTKLGAGARRARGGGRGAEDVPLLGIKAGRYDVQRLIYWHVAKLFWNADMTFEENNHVNFDWYHPRYAHRQTEDEVRRGATRAVSTINHFDVQESGFTVRARH